jgi:hypothetical protein
VNVRLGRLALCLLLIAASARIVERSDSFLIAPGRVQRELFGGVIVYPSSLIRLEISGNMTGDLVQIWSFRLSPADLSKVELLCRSSEVEPPRPGGSWWCVSRVGRASAGRGHVSAEVDGRILRLISATADRGQRR